MPLTDVLVRNAQPGEKPIRLFDGGGLYLEISPSGGKWWRLKYRYGGKEKRLSVGVYPAVSLKEARGKRDELKRQLAAGVDPAVTRKAQRAAQVTATENTFEAIAREWLESRRAALEESTLNRNTVSLERHVFPWLGSRPITAIESPELLAVLRRVEEQGHGETPRRLRQYASQIFRYAIATGRASRDPAMELKGALKPYRAEHHPALTDPKDVGALLRAIDGFRGQPVTRAALRLAPLVFVRPGELRQARWAEFDLAGAMWRIPAERMKMRDAHLVPLSRQAIAILEELIPLTGNPSSKVPGYVFPSARTLSRPMSENTLNGALRRLGYGQDEMTAHGFRSIASTLLNEQGWHRDAIERQLAHTDRDSVRAAYHRAEHLPERKKMMQAWADYLDALRDGAEVVPINRKA